MRQKIFFLLVALTAIIIVTPAAAGQEPPPPTEINGDLNDVGMIVLVTALTQAVKKGIEELTKHAVSAGFAIGLSVVVGFFAVAIKALMIGHPFDLNLLVHFVAIVGAANGGFALLNKILKAIGLAK